MKATPGTLAVQLSLDKDGDPRWTVFDERGYQLATGYTFKQAPKAYQRAEKRGARVAKRLAQAKAKAARMPGGITFQVVYDAARYNDHMEQEVGIA